LLEKKVGSWSEVREAIAGVREEADGHPVTIEYGDFTVVKTL
jgi:hypothetical protein